MVEKECEIVGQIKYENTTTESIIKKLWNPEILSEVAIVDFIPAKPDNTPTFYLGEATSPEISLGVYGENICLNSSSAYAFFPFSGDIERQQFNVRFGDEIHVKRHFSNKMFQAVGMSKFSGHAHIDDLISFLEEKIGVTPFLKATEKKTTKSFYNGIGADHYECHHPKLVYLQKIAEISIQWTTKIEFPFQDDKQLLRLNAKEGLFTYKRHLVKSIVIMVV